MKLYLLPLLCLALAGCSPTITQLKGTYPPPGKNTATTDLSYEEVWDRVIDYIASTGIGVSLVDKDSGLILGNEMSFQGFWCYEKGDKPERGSMYIIAPRISYAGTNVPLTTVTADWNIRVKRGNRTSVTVNLVNIYAKAGEAPKSSGFMVPAFSTGVFESRLINAITHQ